MSDARAYYNEFDRHAAAWLRVLIAEGHIAPGDVDERSIEDVRPNELAGYTQCHFFAGIGVWSLALRQAGWPDDRAVWTGSCPCQPFSAAGKGGGFADERHLWPAFYHLISQCKPAKIIGEQVAAKAVEPWIDLVHADLEALGYAFGCVPFAAASVGAPHIRDRAYWVADTGQNHVASKSSAARTGQSQADRPANQPCRCGSAFGGLADAGDQRCERHQGIGRQVQRGIEHAGSIGGLADSANQRHELSGPARNGRDGLADHSDVSVLANAELQPGCAKHERRSWQRATKGPSHFAEPRSNGKECEPGPTNGFWADVDWLLCRDQKWRPVEPGTFPLADVGAFRNRVAALRGAGNAITLGQAQAFIECVM